MGVVVGGSWFVGFVGFGLGLGWVGGVWLYGFGFGLVCWDWFVEGVGWDGMGNIADLDDFRKCCATRVPRVRQGVVNCLEYLCLFLEEGLGGGRSWLGLAVGEMR